MTEEQERALDAMAYGMVPCVDLARRAEGAVMSNSEPLTPGLERLCKLLAERTGGDTCSAHVADADSKTTDTAKGAASRQKKNTRQSCGSDPYRPARLPRIKYVVRRRSVTGYEPAGMKRVIVRY